MGTGDSNHALYYNAVIEYYDVIPFTTIFLWPTFLVPTGHVLTCYFEASSHYVPQASLKLDPPASSSKYCNYRHALPHLYLSLPTYPQIHHEIVCVPIFVSNITINLSPLEGVGVDIILDCVGGSYWEKNVNCLALDGRWILYGLIGGADVNGPLFSKLLFKRGSLITSLLRPRDIKVSGRRVCHPENCCTDPVIGEPIEKPAILWTAVSETYSD